MANYRFRVTFEDHEEISRDIEIRSNQTFEDFHFAINNAIGFEATKVASFFMSDDNWKKGKEVSNREVSEEQQSIISSLKKSRLCDFIVDPHQKIYYIFDSDNQWTFRLELIKINREDEAGASYPRTVRTMGEAPKQFGGAAAIPVPAPEDFDLDMDLEDEEDEPEVETEDMGVDESEIPEGEDKGAFVASTDEDGTDEFETAEGDGAEEDGFAETDES